MARAKELFAPATGPEAPRNHIAELDQILGFAQKLASIQTANGAERGGWDVGLDFTKELGGPLLQTLNNFMLLRSQPPRGAMMQPPAPGGFPAAPAAFDPYANPEVLRQHARTLNNQPPGAAPTAIPPQPNQGSSAWAAAAAASVASSANPAQAPAGSTDGPQGHAPNEITGLLMQSGGLVLAALNNGTLGSEFAVSVSELFGNGMIADIANYGEDVLTQTMLAFPEFARFGESRIRRFTHEFINYEQFLDSDATDVEAESPESASDAPRRSRANA
jgi:hypothetical protein